MSRRPREASRKLKMIILTIFVITIILLTGFTLSAAVTQNMRFVDVIMGIVNSFTDVFLWAMNSFNECFYSFINYLGF